MTYTLRPYQIEAVNQTIDGLKNKSGNPLIALPTGTGKSLVIGEIIRQLTNQYPKLRVSMITHNKELVKQNAEKLIALYPDADIGVYSAGLKKKQPNSKIMFATVQSIASALKKGNPFGTRHLVIVDEAHLIAPGGSTNYQRVFKEWRKEYPTMKIIGLTATPFRMKGGLLYGNKDEMFDYLSADFCSMEAFNKLLDAGYLAPLIPFRMKNEVDLKNVRTTAGDYNQQDLAKAVSADGLIENAVHEIIEQGFTRKSWLIFCSGIENTERANELFLSRGIRSACVHSKQSDLVNDEIIKGFKAGRIQCVTNANILTTGFDHPGIGLIGMLRPTKSTGLHIQMLGRGTRPCEGKQNCMVMDYAGNTKNLGPINDPVIPGKQIGGGGDAPVRQCPECGCLNHISKKECDNCGFIFPIKEKLSRMPSQTELIADGRPKIERLAVRNISYAFYLPYSQIPCVKAKYRVGNRVFKDYLPFDNPKAAWKCKEWWKSRFPDEPVPESTGAFMELIQSGFEMPIPAGIEVDLK